MDITRALLVTAAALAALYAALCALRPAADCWRCGGTGAASGLLIRGSRRPCRWCDSTGTRIRAGRRLFGWAKAKRRETS